MNDNKSSRSEASGIDQEKSTASTGARASNQIAPIKTSNEWTWFERLERGAWWGAGIFMGAWQAEKAVFIPAWGQAVGGFLLFIILTWWHEKIHRFLGRFALFGKSGQWH